MATSGQLGKITQTGMFAGGMAPVTPVTGVQSISGNGVNNTNPAAPVINGTTAATANTLVYRDANGQAEIAVPTNGPQIANKNYVDAQDVILSTAIGLKANDNAVVHLAGTETITGAKTFSASLAASSLFTLGFSFASVPVTVSTTVTVGNSANQFANATAGNITLTMPVATSTANYEICLTKTDATANTVTVVPQAGGTLGGAASIVLTAQYQSVTLRNINAAVAGAWIVVSKNF